MGPLLVHGVGKLWKSCSLIMVYKGLAPLGKAWSLNLAIAFGKGLLLLPGAALAQLAAIVNPANKPTKAKWGLSWSRALENCGKAVL